MEDLPVTDMSEQLAAKDAEIQKQKQATREAWAAQHDALTKLHAAKARLEGVAQLALEAVEIGLSWSGDDTEDGRRLVKIRAYMESAGKATP